jgi:hypothetical protein
MYGGTEKGIKILRGCLKARGHLLVLDLDGRMVTRKLGVEMWGAGMDLVRLAQDVAYWLVL